MAAKESLSRIDSDANIPESAREVSRRYRQRRASGVEEVAHNPSIMMNRQSQLHIANPNQSEVLTAPCVLLSFVSCVGFPPIIDRQNGRRDSQGDPHEISTPRACLP